MPLRRVRPFVLPRSLPARVLWLTVTVILLVEIVVLIPSLGRERQNWLWDRITDSHLAVYSVESAGTGAGLSDATRMDLLKLSGAEAIELVQPGKTALLVPGPETLVPDAVIDLEQENMFTGMGRAVLAVLGLNGRHLLVLADSPLQPDMRVQVVVAGADLSRHLRVYVEHIAGLSIVIAMVTGLLVFIALNRLLVRPMRIMTASIVGFRQDPENAGLQDLSWLSSGRNDEIAVAARELQAMQDELRAALWRNARLAAVGTAVAKISHDLRNILTSALLVADRLQETADPVARQAANTLIPAVERAAEMVSRTVDFAREGPPALTRGTVVLRDLVDEVAGAIRPPDASVTVDNMVPGSLTLALDRTQIYRVLVNLLRNAAEAGASLITLTIEGENSQTALVVADNGPGLPPKVRENLFRPFTGSGRRGGTGLGLAIARDLIRAHGGDLLLRKTSQDGTVFVMGLATAEIPLA